MRGAFPAAAIASSKQDRSRLGRIMLGKNFEPPATARPPS